MFTKDVGRDLPDVFNRVENAIPLLPIGEEAVFKLLRNIKVDKAAGPDELPNRVLQECASEITPAVTAIFQKSVDSGELPEDWRDANVAPVYIYKKGERHTPENYRPVSLDCVLSKRLEHIICQHMLNHLDKHQVLTSPNHGFRLGYSCETQLAVTAHDLLNFYDQNRQVDAVILDFSKAFDTAPHRKLPHKLDAYGIWGPLHTWIGNFLTQRKWTWSSRGRSHTLSILVLVCLNVHFLDPSFFFATSMIYKNVSTLRSDYLPITVSCTGQSTPHKTTKHSNVTSTTYRFVPMTGVWSSMPKNATCLVSNQSQATSTPSMTKYWNKYRTTHT